jgi:hypothetical protein
VRTVLCILVTATLAAGQSVAPARVPSGSSIFVAPTEGGLDGLLASEIQKLQLPVHVVVDKRQADYILTSSSYQGPDTLEDGLFVRKDGFVSDVKLVRVRDRSLVWSPSDGGRHMIFSSKRGEQEKIAQQVVLLMQKDLFRRAGDNAASKGH